MSPIKYTTEDGRHTLQENVTYDCITIPKGYKWDGASIPRIFRSWIGHPLAPKFARASLIHDWLLENKVLPRKQVDRIFAQELIQAGVKPWRISLMFLAVRAFSVVYKFIPKSILA
jgi:hypothetical protein